MSAPIAVTGATGRIGGRVAQLLADRGVAQRLVVRDRARAPQLPNSEIATITSYADRVSMRQAFEGAHTVFLVSATESPDRRQQHDTAIDAAVAAGVERLVYLSFFKAAPAAVFTFARDHYYAQQHIRSTSLNWTFLQDNFYADFLPVIAGSEGVIRGPAGDGSFAPVAQRDIAEAAATVLASHDGSHDGRAYPLTGPELLTMTDVARIITRETSRDVRYVDETEAEAYESRSSYGAPDWEVDAWVSNYQAIAAGELAPVTDSVETLTGHRATSLAELLRSSEQAR